jgi:hypothetical protein
VERLLGGRRERILGRGLGRGRVEGRGGPREAQRGWLGSTRRDRELLLGREKGFAEGAVERLEDIEGKAEGPPE